MNKSMQSDDVSFFMENQPGLMAPLRTDNVAKSNNPIFFNTKKNISKTVNRALNVLAENKSTSKLQTNEQFQDYLAADQSNSNLVIVTFLGSKKMGKSFLIDSLISTEENAVSRVMTKNSKGLVSIPTFQVKGRNGQKLIYFDCDGQTSNDVFLWTYFLSSIVVLNLNFIDKNGEESFLNNLSYARTRCEADPQDLSLPQLIIIRRDSDNKEFKEKQFLKKIQEYGLFNPDILTLNFSFPGTNSVKTKEIIDVPPSALNKAFLGEVANFQAILKSGKPKTIKGNYLGSKIAGLTLDPLTKSINKDHRVNTGKVWNDVIETLSAGYYNYYIKKYSEQLQKEFGDEKPTDKYTLYKKLSNVRRNIDKKVQGFNNIAGDPTFQKYKEKLQQKINSKQKLIKDINRQKSRNANNQLCKRLFSEMNDTNCERLIDQYCKSPLDDEKSDVLLQNFEGVIKHRMEEMEKSKNPAKKQSVQILALEEELRRIEDQINAEKKGSVNVASYDFDKMKLSIDEKEREVKELEKQLERQKEISNAKKTNQNKDIIELETNIQNLKLKTKNQEKQIQQLRANKESQVKETVQSLNKKLKQEEEKHLRLQEEVRKAQTQASQITGKANAKPGSKDTCCQIM